jgi:metal-sulfur cluster biosynthetic enzyme
MNTTDEKELLADVWKAIGNINDPEFGIPVVDLGLIYDVSMLGAQASIKMTLTTEHCPAGDVILRGVKLAAESVSGVQGADVAIVWEPRWTPNMLTVRARELLGWR